MWIFTCRTCFCTVMIFFLLFFFKYTLVFSLPLINNDKQFATHTELLIFKCFTSFSFTPFLHEHCSYSMILRRSTRHGNIKTWTKLYNNNKKTEHKRWWRDRNQNEGGAAAHPKVQSCTNETRPSRFYAVRRGRRVREGVTVILGQPRRYRILVNRFKTDTDSWKHKTGLFSFFKLKKNEHDIL